MRKKYLNWTHTIIFFILNVGFILLVNFSITFCQIVYVPLNNQVYNFIDRLETQKVLSNVLNCSKPLSRSEVASYLLNISQQVQKGHLLSKVDRDELDFLISEFSEELKNHNIDPAKSSNRISKIKNNRYLKKIIPGSLYYNDRNFLSFKRDQFHVYLDPVYAFQHTYIKSDSVSQHDQLNRFTNGLQLWGYVGNNIGFFIDARDNKEWGSKSYQVGNYTLPRLGFVRATSPDHIYHDETDAYITLNTKYIDVVFGKFKNYWGPGYTGSLILSDYATSYDQLKLEFDYRLFKFSSIYAYLIDYHYQEKDTLQQRKYLAGHRIDFFPWNWLSLGFTETVVFKGRSFEPAYLNPVMFFRSAEHYLGSPDNMMLGADFKLLLVRNIKLYGELLIDDIVTSKLGRGWYGNKLAYLLGIYNTDILKIPNLDFRFEYTRLEPFVYSHRDNSTNYTQYNSILGHWIGPNSDLKFFQLQYMLSRRFVFQSEFSLMRHGSNSELINYGGDIYQGHREFDPVKVRFLDGIVEKEQKIGIKFQYEILRNLFFKFSYVNFFSENVLYENSRKNVRGNRIYFSLGINE